MENKKKILSIYIQLGRLSICLDTAYFAETKNLLLKI